jgi:hypothetical protein
VQLWPSNQLTFDFTPGKASNTNLTLTNIIDSPVAFKVTAT